MPPQLHSVIELIEKSYQFYAFLFTTFVICMGIARWLGKWIWYEAEKLRRKKLRIPVASLISARSEQSFTYWSLAQGGLVGAAVVFYFFVSHIVFDFVFKGRIEGPERFLSFPIGFLAGSVIVYPILHRKQKWYGQDRLIKSRGAVIIAALCLLGDLIVAPFYAGYLSIVLDLGEESFRQVLKQIEASPEVLAVRVLIVVILSLCLSYTLGMIDGLKAADPEANYPVVNVEVLQGSNFDQVWLYERTDSDYRVLTKSGSNHIIPATNVKKIKEAVTTVPEEPPVKEAKTETIFRQIRRAMNRNSP
jgi:hypothetical protein